MKYKKNAGTGEHGPSYFRKIILSYNFLIANVLPLKILSALAIVPLSKNFYSPCSREYNLKRSAGLPSAYIVFSSPIIYNHVNCAIVFKKSIKWVGFPESNISTMIIPPSIYRFITKRLIQSTCPF